MKCVGVIVGVHALCSMKKNKGIVDFGGTYVAETQQKTKLCGVLFKKILVP